LAAGPPEPTLQRINALCAAAVLAGMQVDMLTIRARAEEARSLLDMVGDPRASGLVETVAGLAHLPSGNTERARVRLLKGLDTTNDPEVKAVGTILMGQLLEISGDLSQSMAWYEKGLSLCESHGESLVRSKFLMCVGWGYCLQGQQQAAEQFLLQSLQ